MQSHAVKANLWQKTLFFGFGAPMSTNRSCLAVAVVNDVFYAMGGTLNYQGTFPVGDFPLTNVVEQYIPFGYGTIPPVTTTEPEPFPTAIAVTASGASLAAVIAVGLLLYLRKRKHVDAKQVE